MPISHPPLSGRLVALSPLLMVAACASVPDTGPPAVPRTATEVAAARSLTTTAAAQWPEANAWQTQADPQLAALIAEGLAHSPDLAAAQARIRQATGMAQAAGAPLLPSAEIQGALTVDKLSYNTGFPKAFVPHGWLDNGQLAGALQWDIDLWGRNRAGLAAARSEQRAAEIDAQQSRLLLSTAIALAYSDLARLFEEQDIRTAALALRQSSERLVGQRERGGMDTRGSLRLAEAQTATARAELSATQEALALRRHQIAALVGAGPDRGLDITRPQWREPVLNGLPVDVTTELLARRPDVAMARERIEAAASRVKVARADFYPAIRLSALYGVQALGIDMLFEKDSTFGSAGPAISLPLFRGGALSGRYRNAAAGFDLAVADYDRTVLTAYQQVADAFTSWRLIAERRKDSRAALIASEEAHAIARKRYEGGLSTYLDVLAVEDRLLQARLADNAVQAGGRSADVALIRALGGGFVAPSSKPKDSDDE